MKILVLSFLATLLLSPVTDAKVLYIGDSHSYISEQNVAENAGRFGHVLLVGLRSRGLEVDYYAACGSAPTGWVIGATTNCGYTQIVGDRFLGPLSSRYPALSEIYSAEVYTQLIINHGDNMFNWRAIGSKRVASVNATGIARSLATFFARLPLATPENCTWIGPTYHVEGSIYRKTNAVVDEFYTSLESSLLNKCRLIDSRPLVVPVVPNDGLHHVSSDSRTWAQGVLNHL